MSERETSKTLGLASHMAAQITMAEQRGYHEGFLACREAAAKVARPKETRPCDCDYCDCGNNGSARDVARWDAETYIAAAIEALTPGER